MKKTLVYHAYFTREFQNNLMYAVHHYCLSKHISLFDRVDFTVVVDDLSDNELIDNAIEWVKGITNNAECEYNIRVRRNTEFGDSQTFYDRIIRNNNPDDDLVFFFHTKGVCSGNNEEYSINSVLLWVLFIYFTCLQEIKDVGASLCGTGKSTYGPLLTSSFERPQDFPFMYCGTGFWVNIKAHKALMGANVLKEIPLYSKYYAENYYGKFLTYFQSFGMDSVSGVWFSFEDLGVDFFYKGSIQRWYEMAECVNKLEGFSVYVEDVCEKIGYELCEEH